MKSITGTLLVTCLICLLTGCNTTTQEPDINSLQPSQQQLNQENLQRSIYQ